jgi:hypothetical protein
MITQEKFEKALHKLKLLQSDGLAVEEATKDELIESITEMKLKIDEVVEILECCGKN